MAEVVLILHGQASFGSANYDQLSALGGSRHSGWASSWGKWGINPIDWLLARWRGTGKPQPGLYRV